MIKRVGMAMRWLRVSVCLICVIVMFVIVFLFVNRSFAKTIFDWDESDGCLMIDDAVSVYYMRMSDFTWVLRMDDVVAGVDHVGNLRTEIPVCDIDLSDMLDGASVGYGVVVAYGEYIESMSVWYEIPPADKPYLFDKDWMSGILEDYMFSTIRIVTISDAKSVGYGFDGISFFVGETLDGNIKVCPFVGSDCRYFKNGICYDVVFMADRLDELMDDSIVLAPAPAIDNREQRDTDRFVSVFVPVGLMVVIMIAGVAMAVAADWYNRHGRRGDK